MMLTRTVARVMMALIFVLAGVSKVMPGAASTTAKYMESGFHNVGIPAGLIAPFHAYLPIVAFFVGCFELVAGVLFVIGYEETAATMMFSFLALITPIMHAFWAVPASQSQVEMVRSARHATRAVPLMQCRRGPARKRRYSSRTSASPAPCSM